MGLDWNPANKPIPGSETEFWQLVDELNEGNPLDIDSKMVRYNQLSVSAFETLGAPRIGLDAKATTWAMQLYTKQRISTPLDQWLKNLHGLYVVDLVPRNDGIPRYSNGQFGGDVEPFAFRGQFLVDCEYIIGTDLLESAFRNKRPKELQAYGVALGARASEVAASRGIDLSAIADPSDPESIEFHLDVVNAACRWCHFWAEQGHWLEAYW